MGEPGQPGEGSGARETPVPTYSWEEIRKHCLPTDKWLVIQRKVYDITRWADRHPGGSRLISHHAGEDATMRLDFWGCCFSCVSTAHLAFPRCLKAS